MYKGVGKEIHGGRNPKSIFQRISILKIHGAYLKMSFWSMKIFPDLMISRSDISCGFRQGIKTDANFLKLLISQGPEFLEFSQWSCGFCIYF